EISVADNGPGIPPAFLPHVFERFRQADASRTRRHGGLGIGLAIVSKLVELHGGVVTAAHRSEGGAIFTVALPRGDPQAAVQQEVTPAAPVVSLDGLRVLVIDDAPDDRVVIARV